MLLIHTYCTKLLYLLYVPTAVRAADDVCYYLLLYVLPVPTGSTYRWRTYVRKEKPGATKRKTGLGRLFWM